MADKTLMMKIMSFFVTLIFLILEIIRYSCELTLAQLPIMAEMTNCTGVGKHTKSQQERYIRQTIPPSTQKDIENSDTNTADRFSARELPARPDSTDIRLLSYWHKRGSRTRTSRQSHRQLWHMHLSSYFSSFTRPLPFSFTEHFSTRPFSFSKTKTKTCIDMNSKLPIPSSATVSSLSSSSSSSTSPLTSPTEKKPVSTATAPQGQGQSSVQALNMPTLNVPDDAASDGNDEDDLALNILGVQQYIFQFPGQKGAPYFKGRNVTKFLTN